MTETFTVTDPLEQIRAEIERVKGWPKSSGHRNGHPPGRCDACSCRWPCTGAEVALDAARMARALERVSTSLAYIATNSGDRAMVNVAEQALADIAKLLTEDPHE